MQPLRVANVSRVGPERCARDLLAAVPAIMRFIRQEMRGHRQRPLTVPQFRSLVFLNMHEDASLSAVAEHVGLSLPAASRLVELLVKRGFIERRARSNDRRSVALTLTGRGRTAFNLAHEATQAALAERFAALPVHERALVSQAMEILARAFAPSAVPPEPEN